MMEPIPPKRPSDNPVDNPAKIPKLEQENSMRIIKPRMRLMAKHEQLDIMIQQNECNGHMLILVLEAARSQNLPPPFAMRLLQFSVKMGSLDAIRLLLRTQHYDLRCPEGGVLLRNAIIRGHARIAILLVQANANVNMIDMKGWTILHHVVRSAAIDNQLLREMLLRSLLDKNLDINACDNSGQSVLRAAIRSKCCPSRIVELLLNRGATVTINDESFLNDMYWAAVQKEELIPKMVQHQAFDDKTRNMRGVSAFNELVKSANPNSLKIIKRILDLGIPVDSSCQSDKYSPATTLLHQAVLQENKGVMKLLLDYGANPHVKDLFGHSLLYDATLARKGYTDASRLLIAKGASIRVRNADGRYPIHGACLHNSERVLHLLLGVGARLDVTDHKGSTPFQCTTDIFDFTGAHRLAITHLAIMFVKRGKINDGDMEKIYSDIRAVELFEICKDQLELMKRTYVCYGINYFALLNKDMARTIALMKHPDFARNFQENKNNLPNMFPNYSNMLINSFNIAESRYKVFVAENARVTGILRNVIDIDLPDHINETIALFACVGDLDNCQRDYYLTLHASLKKSNSDNIKIR